MLKGKEVKIFSKISTSLEILQIVGRVWVCRIWSFYTGLIYSCAGLVGEQKKVDDYVKAFNQRINGRQQGGMPQHEECQAR